MKKTISALLAAATLAGSLAVAPANAQRGVAAGVAAGLIGGAIVGGAIASSRPAYGGPGYVGEGPPCRRGRERFLGGYRWGLCPGQGCNLNRSSRPFSFEPGGASARAL